jgi:hypothetical protein
MSGRRAAVRWRAVAGAALRTASGAVVCAALVGSWSTPARAQQSPAASAVVGRVTDTLGVALAGAHVLVDGVERAVSDDSGRFTVRGLEPARFFLVGVRRLGYAELAATLVAPDSANAVRGIFQLAPTAQTLARVRVIGDRTTAAGRFDKNRRSRNGFFLDRAEIEKRAPTVATDLFFGVPWVQVRGGAQRVVMGRRTGKGACPMGLVVNGFVKRLDQDLDFDLQVGPVHLIEAVEVYARATEVPAEYLLERNAMLCGVIVVWTRIAVDPPRGQKP